MSLGYFDFEFAKSHFFFSLPFSLSRSFEPSNGNIMMIYEMLYYGPCACGVGLRQTISLSVPLSLSHSPSVSQSVSAPSSSLCLPRHFLSLSLRLPSSLHLNVLITWGDAALMLTPSKKHNLLFIYLH